MESYKKWGDVPSNLKTKTMLNKEGLKPISKPVATVYQRINNEYIDLYDINDTISKKVLSDKQKEVLDNEYNIINVSSIYTGRGDTKYCNQYIDLELKEGLANE